MRNEWKIIIQRHKKEILKGFAFILILFLLLVYIEVQSAMIYSRQLDSYFSIIYAKEIYPNGEREIKKILNEVQNISDNREKLNAIGQWETKDFTNIFWEKGLKNNTKFGFTPMDGFIGRYFYDNNGKIRAFNSLFGSNTYTTDPVWIAYYKTGACGELAVLFANVTNRSGFETQVVIAELKSLSPFPFLENIPLFDYVSGNHAWVEVKVNNEWLYFDPDTFGQHYLFEKETQRNGWFNQTKYYRAFSPRQVGRVYLATTNEDVKDRYPLLMGYTQHKDSLNG